jgi:peptide chain release factor 2
LTRQQIESLLSGEADSNDSFSKFIRRRRHREPGLGVNMLMRMYTRWSEKQGYKVEIIELHDGEEAGIKSATLLIKGHNAYGLAEDRKRRAPAGADLAL